MTRMNTKQSNGDNQNFCIYSNKNILDEEKGIEHVIPLSLGGCNEFTIFTSEKKNNEYGTTIEGPFTKDFFICINRIKNNTKGHSKKEPNLILKGSSNNHPVAIKVSHGSKTTIFDYIDNMEIFPSELHISASIDVDCYIPMIAKTILAAGYYKYGDSFNKYVDCDSLRLICDNAKNGEWINLANQGRLDNILYSIRFSEINQEEKSHQDYFAKAFEESNVSGVAFEFVEDRLLAFIGFNGFYVGMLNVPSNNKELNKNSPELARLWMVVSDKQYVEVSLNYNDFKK